MRTNETNSTFAIGSVSCSSDTFVVNQTLVLRINICGKNSHLRQAQKCYRQPLTTVVRSIQIVRASGIIGLINLTYNIFRYEQIVRLKIL